MEIKKNEYDYLLKYLLIGNACVGKSSLVLRYTDNIYYETYKITIGVDFKIKTLEIDETNVKINIWDTAGHERFNTIHPTYFKGANGVMLVYDITSIDSFNKLPDWLIEIEKNSPKNVFKILIGNKLDLNSKREVSYDLGKVSFIKNNFI